MYRSADIMGIISRRIYWVGHLT